MPEEVEKVLVVPRARLWSPGRPPPHGFVPAGAEEYLKAVDEAGVFVEREDAEKDPSLKQIIPYAVLEWADRVFLMRRSGAGGEARLHGKATIGVGGHVNPCDRSSAGPPAPLRAAVERALERELAEELAVEAPWEASVAGAINDESNPVGSVHLGIVYRLRLGRPAARVRSPELAEGAFVPTSRLESCAGALETWSLLLARGLWGTPASDFL